MSLQITGQAQGLVVPIAQKSGQANAVSTGWNNELLVSELIPRYAALALSGNVFDVTYTAASLAIPSATATGSFALFNPAGSGKNLVLLKVAVGLQTFTAGTTALGIGLQYVPNITPTTTTPGNVPQNALVGSQLGAVAKPFTAGTLVGAPTVLGTIFETFYADLAASSQPSGIQVEVDGAIIVAPGSGICLCSTAAPITNTVTCAYKWAELPA